MSKLIVEMEMPKHMCCDCEISIDGFACKKSRTKGGKCPIVGVLPDEHGDLIDRDEVKKEIMKRMPSWCGTSGTDGYQFCSRREMLYPISRAQAVIAAERKNDGK